jgi:hypothetical protein
VTEFKAWPKTPRLFRDVVITEKIDGTNAAIHIEPGTRIDNPMVFEVYPLKPGEVYIDGQIWRVAAQSRNRLITPGADNYGFARWVYDNAAILVPLLGEGLHFGEWWGRGIQRGYGLDERRFSLFNTDRHRDVCAPVGGVTVSAVPVLYHGVFREREVTGWLRYLAEFGSVAARGFPNPEGVCVFHTQSRTVFKATLDNNDAGKWETA